MNIPDTRDTVPNWPRIIGLLLVLGGAAYWAFAGRTVSDPAGTMPFDAAKPFKLDFGRGSEWHGLDTIAMEEDGQVSLYRQTHLLKWEHASLHLSPKQVEAVALAVKHNGLPHLAKKYLQSNLYYVYDGTQWVVWIRQGQRQKATYFDNHFPASIRDFAKELDGILMSAGYYALQWQATDSADHDKALWKSYK
jgi:hypothetical protein